jgi:hypothetical protein
LRTGEGERRWYAAKRQYKPASPPTTDALNWGGTAEVFRPQGRSLTAQADERPFCLPERRSI